MIENLKLTAMKAILGLFFLIAIFSCKTDNQFVIEGTIDGNSDDEWIYLTEFLEPEPYIDSVLINNGRFTFKGNVDYPEVHVLNNNSDTAFKYFYFFLEPATMEIRINPGDWTYGSTIMGGPVNDEYNEKIRSSEIRLVNLNRETMKKMSGADSTEQIELEQVRKESEDQHKQLCLDFISDHPDSPISPYLLGDLFVRIPFDEAQNILNSFSNENKQTSICLSLQERLDMMKKYINGSLETE